MNQGLIANMFQQQYSPHPRKNEKQKKFTKKENMEIEGTLFKCNIVNEAMRQRKVRRWDQIE